MKLFHNTYSSFTKFNDRPTWFWTSIELVNDMQAVHGGTNLVCEIPDTAKLASIDEVELVANQIWPDAPLIYSMFDEKIGEFNKSEITKFINLLRHSFNGAYLYDYHPMNSDKTAISVVIFNPAEFVKIHA